MLRTIITNVKTYTKKTGFITAIFSFAGFIAASALSLFDEKLAVIVFVCSVIAGMLLELFNYRKVMEGKDKAEIGNILNKLTDEKQSAEIPEVAELSDVNKIVETAEKADEINEEKNIAKQEAEIQTKEPEKPAIPTEKDIMVSESVDSAEVVDNLVDAVKPTEFVYEKVICCKDYTENLKTDLINLIEAKLNDFEHISAFASPVIYVFTEIWDNAIKHGCKQESPEVSIKMFMSAEKFSCTIKDNGDGFDYSAKIKELENREMKNEASFPEFENGRGLLSIKGICDSFEINEQGNEVSVVLLKNRCLVNENTRVLNLPEMIDSEAFNELESEFTNLSDRGEKFIIVDFDKVKYICSSMYSFLVQTFEKIGKDGGFMVFANVSSETEKNFANLGLNDYFLIFQSVDAASAYINEKNC